MQEEKPRERIVELRQYQKEPNHSVVVVVDFDWISLYSLLHIHLFLYVVDQFRVVSIHSRIYNDQISHHAYNVNHTSRASILFL